MHAVIALAVVTAGAAAGLMWVGRSPSPNAATSTTQRTQTAPRACSLLTVEEMAAVIGEPVKPGTPAGQPLNGSSFDLCWWELVSRPGRENAVQIEIFSSTAFPPG